MTSTIFAIIQITNKEVIFKSYYSLKRLCKENGFNYDEVKDRVPFKHKDIMILKSELDSRI
jgi:hypothetical protein